MFLRGRGWWLALVFLAYFAITVIVTWPLLLEWDHSLPGSSTDSYVHYWNGWWVREALRTGQSPYYSHFIFYPQGVSLVLHNLAWLSIAPWLILQLMLPGIVAYNLVLLLNLALCGFAAYLLVDYLTENHLAAFTAGLIYLAWPFRTAQLDHPNLISTYWLPVALLFIIKWIREGRIRHVIFAGIGLALVGYTRWQMLIPAAFVVVVYLAGTLWIWGRSRRAWTGLVLIATLTALLLAPPAALLAREWQTTITSRADLLREGEEAVLQTDLLAYVTPGSNHPLWGDLFEPSYERYYAERSEGRRFVAYVGLAAIVLTAVGLWRRRDESLPWLLIALTLIALAMGAVLRINGQLYPEAPTLYRLLEPLYVVRLIRVPDRFNMTLALPFAVMAGYGVAAVLARVRQRQVLIAGALSALILFEYLAAPIPRLDARVAPIYDQLPRLSSPSALLNLPMDQQRAKTYMFAQTAHGRPIVQGKVARIPAASYAYIESQPWLLPLHQYNEMAPWLTDVRAHLAALAQDNIDYIILHKNLVEAHRLLRWQRYLIAAPVYEDEEVAIYTTRPAAGVHFSLNQELAPGIGPLTAHMSATCVRAGEALSADVAWGAAANTRQAYAMELLLRNEAGEIIQRSRAPQTLQQMSANSLLWRYLTLELPDTIAPGSYELTLSLLPEGANSEGRTADGEQWRLGLIEVREQRCQYDGLPAAATGVDARFGNQLKLLGYELARDGERLELTLYWRLMQHMETNYKVFVHLFEPGTGVPVAQDDAMPQRGAYPTRFWAAGETDVDHIPLDLRSVGPGNYGIAVGVYDADTLQRLALFDGDGNAVDDGRLVLENEVIQVTRARSGFVAPFGVAPAPGIGMERPVPDDDIAATDSN